MYRLFIVDDERLELEMLCDYIDWSSMDIRVIGSARNGKSAWEQVRELQPDIVLTDVKMPIMDGLELAQHIRDGLPHIKVVFLSGFDDFHYIRTALTVEASGYLLKPVAADELRTVMDKVKLKCDADRMLNQSADVLREKLAKDLVFETDSSKRDVLAAKLGQLDRRLGSHVAAGAVISVDNERLLRLQRAESEEETFKAIGRNIEDTIRKHLPEAFAVRTKEAEYFVICGMVPHGDDEDGSAWTRICEDIRCDGGCTVTIGVCTERMALSRVNELYAKAQHSVQERFYAGPGRVLYAGQVGETSNVPLLWSAKPLFEALLHQREEEAYGLLGQFFDTALQGRIRRDTVMRASIACLDSIWDYLIKHEQGLQAAIGDKTELWNKLYGQDTVQGLKEELSAVLRALFAHLEEKQKDNHAQIVRQVKAIIDGSLHEQLTVEDLAGKVFLSPKYLSTLFKEKTQETILEYITRCRMEKATELLQNKSLKIRQISMQLSYENVSYFCSLFQKYKGATPNEYRKKLL